MSPAFCSRPGFRRREVRIVEMGVDLGQIARECASTSRAEAGESAKSAKVPSVNSISKTAKNTNFSVFDNEMADGTMALLALTRVFGYIFSDKISGSA